MVFFCKFIPLFALLLGPANKELWFTLNSVSEKTIVNTFVIITLRVNSCAASLPRNPGHMVLYLFFGFAMSSTMTASFLYHVVRERECIQSYFVKLSSGFAVNQALSASAVHITSRIISFESLLNDCGRHSAASRHEVLLDEDDFRFFLTSSWTRWCSASFTTACDNPGTLKSMSSSSTLVDSCPPTGLTVLVWSSSSIFVGINTQLYVDSDPHTGLSVLV